MKITKVDIVHVTPRFSLLTLHTDDGLVGYGEAIVEGKSRTVETAVREMEPYLIGQDPRRIEFLWQALYRSSFYRGGPVLNSAISGLEQAMWDILGKSLNAPVYVLLGGAVRDKIRMYEKINAADPRDCHREAQRAKANGFTMVKTIVSHKAGILESPAYRSREVERIEALRDALGPEIDLAVDFHGRLGPANAIRLAKELERFGLLFIEEPCLPENTDVLQTIARSTTIPIATGERLFTKWGFREVLEKQAAAVIQPDLAHCGGIAEAKKIAAMAECYYAAFAPHNPLGPVNLAASLHVSANVPNFLAQEYFTLGEGLLKRPFVIKDGYVELPEGPGLGVEIDEEAVAEAASQYKADFRLPLWICEQDGSIADW